MERTQWSKTWSVRLFWVRSPRSRGMVTPTMRGRFHPVLPNNHTRQYTNNISPSPTIKKASMSTDSLMGLLILVGPGCCVEMNFRKNNFRKKLNYGTTSVRFDLRTSVVRLWRINHWATQWALTGIWSLDLFCSFTKDKPMSSSANGDWVVF